MTTHLFEIWIWVQHRDADIDPHVPGLINEARKMGSMLEGSSSVTAVLTGSDLEALLPKLSNAGVDKIRYAQGERLEHFQGELAARILADMADTCPPCAVLMAQNDQADDLAPRLAALTQSALVTQVMDFRITPQHDAAADRILSNGYLFETVTVDMENPPVICFNPAVLTDPEPDCLPSPAVRIESFVPQWADIDLKTRVLEVIAADAGDLDLEDADIIVAGGRGAGNMKSFEKLHHLASILKGPVAGTRPVIDSDILPYERQIGQTGKIVNPKLLINFGISGANEYTAGIEKSKSIVAVNTDDRARIFNFVDLGLVGDTQQILDALIDRIKKAAP